MSMLRFSAVVHKEGRWFVSWCPELDVASQGRTVEQALKNLREAVGLHLDDKDAKVPSDTPLITVIEVPRAKPSRSVRA